MSIADLYELHVKTTLRLMPGGDELRHILYGVVLFLLLRRGGDGKALGLLAAIEALNELADRLHYGSWRWHDTAGDIVNTLAIPAALAVTPHLARMIDALQRNGSRRASL